MLPITVNQRDAVAKSSVLQAEHRVIANFNFNRFLDITSVTNPLSTADDNELFPISSVVGIARPEAGIVKAMIGGSGGYPQIGKVGGVLTASDKDLWSYTVSKDDKYKYWRSPELSTSSLYLGTAGHYTLPNAQIQVLYAAPAAANKIIVGFENTYISPKHITIEHRVGTTWTPQTISNPTLDSAGRLILYRQGDNTWGTTVNRGNIVDNVNGVRLTVNAVSAQNANAYVIELAVAREVDVTADVISVSSSDSVSEHSLLLPIGDVSSNEATVVLDNTARQYSPKNTGSTLNRFMGKWGEFTFELNLHRPGVAAASNEWVQIFRRIVESFEEGDNQVTFDLKDSSMILQDSKPATVTLKDVSVTAIAVYLCHSVGFRRVAYTIQDIDPQDTHSRLKYYWVDPDKSVWESLQDLSEATQTAFYFDESDTLQIETRAAAFDLAKSPVWIFDSEDLDAAAVTAQGRSAPDVGKLADLQEFTETEIQRPNDIDVKYVPTEASKVTRGIPAMTVAWEPDGVTTLRSTNLSSDIPLNTSTEHYIKLYPPDAVTWPYTGMFQIDTEIIKYEGKEYSYYLANGTVATKYIESAEEKAALDALNEGLAWRNVFTGNFRVKVGGRGYKNTVPAAHSRSGRNYTCRLRTGSGSMVSGAKYVTKDLNGGWMRLNNVAYKPGVMTRLVARTQGPNVAAPRIYGTKFKFPTSGYTAGVAGLFLSGGTNDAGIYVEVIRTAVVGSRTVSHEINVRYKNSAGTETLYGKGAMVAIAAGVDYQLDVALTSDSTYHYITTYIDGARRLVTAVPKATVGANLSSDFGVFIRGNTICDFGYLYAYGGQPDDTGFDGSTYLDLIKGGYRSAVFREIQTIPSSTGFTQKPVSTSWKRNSLNSTVIDEFGAIVHEVRDFVVEYTEKPALHSMLYLSNTAQVACSTFVPSPVGATFTLVNVSRKTAVVNGEDTLTYGADNSVDQKLLIYGRMIVQEEPKTKNVKNSASIVRTGNSELTVESNWIQTEEQASRIASWLISGAEVSEGDLKAYANPYIQLLDMVAVQDPDNYRDWATSKYFVMARDISYDGGLTVDFTLRRAV